MKYSDIKISKTSTVILVLIFLSFLVSLFFWILHFPGIRRTYTFHASDSDKLMVETRYAPIKPAQGKINYYIEELLLGPVAEHCNPVFNKGTTLLSCFQRGNVLYVNVSKDLLKADAFSTDFSSQIDLFKKNVRNNFPQIKTIEFFIDGETPFKNKN